MIAIRAELLGADSVLASVRASGPKARLAILRVVMAWTIMLQRKVKENLGGPSSKTRLGVRSGRLRRSITQKVTEGGNLIKGRVGTVVKYGRFWELGFHGTENVKAHLRRTKAQMKRRLRGAQAGPREQAHTTVSAHTRKVDQNPRPFLHPALAEIGPGFRDAVKKAATAAVREGIRGR